MATKYNPTAENYRRPSLTAHNRLISSTVSIDYETNLRAEISDPLWLLARQWQMGEFKAENTSTPAFARVEWAQVQPQKLQLDPNKPTENYDARQQPLEVLVECEGVLVNIHTQIQAGFYFQKLLKINNLSQYHPVFLDVYFLDETTLPAWDIEGQTLLKTVQGQLTNGYLLVKDFKEGRLKKFIINNQKFKDTPSVPQALLNVADALNSWFDRTYPNYTEKSDQAKPKAWKQEQLEYGFQFDVKDSSGKGGSLGSNNYADGQLDWPDFTWSGDPNLPNAVKKTESFVPTSVRYQGMPHPRLWEMEEGRVNFGKISTAPINLFSTVFAEFGLAYSNDWFWIPIPLKINTLCRINSLSITTVFGDTIVFPPPVAPTDDPLSIFSLFQLSHPSNNSSQAVFYLPPTIANVQEAEPLERVYFLRDELANLVWAVETIAPSATQRGIEQRLTSPEPVVTPDAANLVYKLGKVMPENWTPFVPVRMSATSNQIKLQRAQMPNGAPPKGQILQDKLLRTQSYFVREEEIGRSGTVVERSWQRARWLNGKTFTWIGRRKNVGSIEAVSSPIWDAIESKNLV